MADDSDSDQRLDDVSLLNLPSDFQLPQYPDGLPLLTDPLPNVNDSDIDLPYRYGDLPRLLIKVDELAEALYAINLDQNTFFQTCQDNSIIYLVDLWLKPLSIPNCEPIRLNGAYLGARVILQRHYRLDGNTNQIPVPPYQSHISNAITHQQLQQMIADAVQKHLPSTTTDSANTSSNAVNQHPIPTATNSASIKRIANNQHNNGHSSRKITLSNKLFSRPDEMDELAWLKHCSTTLTLLSTNVDQDELLNIFLTHAVPEILQKLAELAHKSGIARFSNVKAALEALQNDTTTYKCQTKARNFIANAKLSDPKYTNDPRQLFIDIKDHMRSFSSHLSEDQLVIEVERAFKLKMPALTQVYLCDIKDGQYLAKMKNIEENLMILSSAPEQASTSQEAQQLPTKFEKRIDAAGRTFYYPIDD